MTDVPGQLRHPNILCVVTDQRRPDHMGCAGNTILQTPNLDRLAANGMRFSRCYTDDPMCCPARATMWTGHRSLSDSAGTEAYLAFAP
jgi:arylsulfatase A-like enzyme